MKKLSVVLAIVAMAVGCAAASPLQTGGGGPAITICKAGKTELMEKLAAMSSGAGVKVKTPDSGRIIVSKPVTDPATAALFGTRYNPTPEHREIMTFTAAGNNCTDIGIVIQIVTNPGSPYEKVTDVSKGKDAQEAQDMLQSFKARVEGSAGAGYGGPGKDAANGKSGTPAEKKIEIYQICAKEAKEGEAKGGKWSAIYGECLGRNGL